MPARIPLDLPPDVTVIHLEDALAGITAFGKLWRLLAVVLLPIARELSPIACVPDPGTPAVPPQPMAMAAEPDAPLLTPIAMEEDPLAKAPLPTARAAAPELVD